MKTLKFAFEINCVLECVLIMIFGHSKKANTVLLFMNTSVPKASGLHNILCYRLICSPFFAIGGSDEWAKGSTDINYSLKNVNFGFKQYFFGLY